MIKTSFSNYKYVMNFSNLLKLQGWLLTADYTDNISLLLENPGDYIVGCTIYPFNVKDFINRFNQELTQLSTITVGTTPTSGTFLAEGYAWKSVIDMNSALYTMSMGTIDLTSYGNSFLDYSPYLIVDLYLPLIGFITLDTNYVVGKILDIQYVFDFDNNDITAHIYTRQQGEVLTRKILTSASSKLGIELPLGSSNSAEVARNQLLNGIKMATDVMTTTIAFATAPFTGGLSILAGAGMTSGIVRDATNEISQGVYHYNGGRYEGSVWGAINVNEDIIDNGTIPRPFVKICRFISVPNNSLYNNLYGRPLNVSKRLDTVYGYTEIGSIHLDGFSNAETQELQMITNLLKTGVMFPKLVTFTVLFQGGTTTTLQSPENLTWEEWCNSSFNDLGFYTRNGQYEIFYRSGSTIYELTSMNEDELHKDTFVAAGDYKLVFYDDDD